MKTAAEIRSASLEEKKRWLFSRHNALASYREFLGWGRSVAQALDMAARREGLTPEEICEIVGVDLEEVTK